MVEPGGSGVDGPASGIVLGRSDGASGTGRLPGAQHLEPLGQLLVLERQDLRGEQPGVGGAGAWPIASVPTGTPAGICTMESRLSWPASALVVTGTPSTGSVVRDAVMPGRCAAPPAPAMITLRPRALAPLAYS